MGTGSLTTQYWSNIPVILKANLNILVGIQKIEEYLSNKCPTIRIVDPNEIEREYEDY